MLILCNQEGMGAYPLEEAQDLSILWQYSGEKSLSFSISPQHPNYKQLREQSQLLYDGQYYVVRAINERRDLSTVDCDLDLDSLRGVVYQSFQREEKTLSQVLEDALVGTYWTVQDAGLVYSKGTLDLQDVTPYDILSACQELFSVVYDFDNRAKVITVIKPDALEPTGVYLTDELNLISVDFKGSSDNLCTRLYPYGKDGLDITGVTENGEDYIEDYSFCPRRISQIWRDDQYTDPYDLLQAARAKLAVLAKPERSYSCSVMDVAKMNPDYANLRLTLYDTVTLVDRNHKATENLQVVEYKEYPAAPQNNTVTLSSVPKKVESTLENVQTNVGSLSGSLAQEREKVNEIRRDMDVTFAHIQENVQVNQQEIQRLDSSLTQSVDGMRLQVQETLQREELLEQKTSQLEQSLNELTFQTEHRGGDNLLFGTAAYNLDGWEWGGQVLCTRTTNEAANTTFSGGLFQLGGDAATQLESSLPSHYIRQSVQEVVETDYAYRLKYKLTGTGTVDATISIGTDRYTSQGQAGDPYSLSITGEWVELTGTIRPQGKTLTFLAGCNNGVLKVADLILVKGREILGWNQSQNEITTGQVTISGSKIVIEDTTQGGGNAFRAQHDNHQSVYLRGEEIIARFSAEDGAEMGSTTVNGDLILQRERKNPTGALHILHLTTQEADGTIRQGIAFGVNQ